jgi:hypothetical protein
VFDPRQRQRIFPLASASRLTLGAHPASCTMDTGGPFPGGKAQPGRDADHSPPSSAEVKNEQELYLLSPHMPPWCIAGQLYFTFIPLSVDVNIASKNLKPFVILPLESCYPCKQQLRGQGTHFQVQEIARNASLVVV